MSLRISFKTFSFQCEKVNAVISSQYSTERKLLLPELAITKTFAVIDVYKSHIEGKLDTKNICGVLHGYLSEEGRSL